MALNKVGRMYSSIRKTSDLALKYTGPNINGPWTMDMRTKQKSTLFLGGKKGSEAHLEVREKRTGSRLTS